MEELGEKMVEVNPPLPGLAGESKETAGEGKAVIAIINARRMTEVGDAGRAVGLVSSIDCLVFMKWETVE
jgi:hypothetical protein